MTSNLTNESRHQFEHTPGMILTSDAGYSAGPPGFSSTPSHTSITGPYPYSKVVDDVVNRGYKKRVANGEVFNNPYSSFARYYTADDSFVLNYSTDVGHVYRESCSPGFKLTQLYQTGQLQFPELQLADDDAERNAQLQALGNVNKTDLDSMTFVAEWSKTKQLHRDLGNALIKVFTEGPASAPDRDMVRKLPVYDRQGNPVLNKAGKPIVRYTHDVKKGFSRGANRSKALSNLYLVGRYGIGPLLHDLEDACKYLTKTRHVRETARGVATKSDTRTSVKELPVSISGVARIELRSVGTRTVRYGILYETSTFMSGAAALGLTRPLSTLWELIPYSFVIDWFINVGGWLDAIQPSGASKTLSAWVSTHTSATYTARVTASGRIDRPWYQDHESFSWGGSLTLNEISRSRGAWSCETPKFPSFGSGFNPLRSLDFAALVLQKIRF